MPEKRPIIIGKQGNWTSKEKISYTYNNTINKIYEIKKSIKKMDKIFEAEVTYYENQIELRQKIQFIPNSKW